MSNMIPLAIHIQLHVAQHKLHKLEAKDFACVIRESENIQWLLFSHWRLCSAAALCKAPPWLHTLVSSIPLSVMPITQCCISISWSHTRHVSTLELSKASGQRSGSINQAGLPSGEGVQRIYKLELGVWMTCHCWKGKQSKNADWLNRKAIGEYATVYLVIEVAIEAQNVRMPEMRLNFNFTP
jgi:hypothetical protein